MSTQSRDSLRVSGPSRWSDLATQPDAVGIWTLRCQSRALVRGANRDYQALATVKSLPASSATVTQRAAVVLNISPAS